ncbi:MAG: hypothetical protein ABSF69_19155 [Polyangiaceae bacterium]
MSRKPLHAAVVTFVFSLAVVTSLPLRADGDPQALVTWLEHDVTHRRVTAEAVSHARDALERARRFRDLHDDPRARNAEALAREWAEVGRDLARAFDAEGRAAEMRRRAMESQARLERTRALVDEAVARIGRLQAEIAETQGPNDRATAGVGADGGVAPTSSPDPQPTPEIHKP